MWSNAEEKRLCDIVAKIYDDDDGKAEDNALIVEKVLLSLRLTRKKTLCLW